MEKENKSKIGRISLKKIKFLVDELCILQVFPVNFQIEQLPKKSNWKDYIKLFFVSNSCYLIVEKDQTYAEHSRNMPSFVRESQNISRARFEGARGMLRPYAWLFSTVVAVYCFGPKPCLDCSFYVKLCHRARCWIRNIKWTPRPGTY